MRFGNTATNLLAVVAVVGLDLVGGDTAAAQSQVNTLDELRRELTVGDVVTAVNAAGESVTGRLVRVDDNTLELVLESPRGKARATGGLHVTIPLVDLRGLDRPRDSTKDGVLLGAAIGGGSALAMFLYAIAVDRNEVDEWGPVYLAVGGAFTGVGAFTGWAIDRAHSKGHIRFGVLVNQPRTISRLSAGLALKLTF